jgi:uncharacterized protein YgiM (DUF1202 family)
MLRSKGLLPGLTAVGVFLLLLVLLAPGAQIRAEAKGRGALNSLVGGLSGTLNPSEGTTEDAILSMAERLHITLVEVKLFEEEEESTLVMANVKNALNVRSEPDEEAEKVGMLYKDCGGTILERQDGWTKLKSGNLVGWANDDYLLFDEEAEAMAEEVGITLAVVNTETLRVRSGPGTDEGVLGLVPNGEVLEVVEVVEIIPGEEEEEDDDDEPLASAITDEEDADENDPHVYDEEVKEEEAAPVIWVCVDYEGKDGYISAEYVTTSFHVDAGETIEEIKAREKAEAEAKRHVNYDAISTDADTARLLAALIQCEAGGECYDGQVAVGAVVMNRVRSGAYPNTIYGVIFASGQFTPAMNGKVGTLYNSGKISQSCINAANEAISGVSNVGSCTHFRRNDGREGIVIGNHVFY